MMTPCEADATEAKANGQEQENAAEKPL